MSHVASRRMVTRSPRRRIWSDRTGSHRRAMQRGFVYAITGYLFVLFANPAGFVVFPPETSLPPAGHGLVPTILAPGAALLGAVVAWWPSRRVRLEGDDSVRHKMATAVVVVGVGTALLIDGAVSASSVLIVGTTALLIMNLALVNRGAHRTRPS